MSLSCVSFSIAALAAPQVTIDATFGDDGVAKIAFAKRMALTSEGKLVALGQDEETLVLYRYTRNGTPDLSFGNQGSIRLFAKGVRFNTEAATSLLVAADGRIYLAGLIGDGCPTFDAPCSAPVLARYLPTGDLDTSFGAGGFAPLSIGRYGPYRQNVHLAFAPGGAIVAAENASSEPFRGGPPVVVRSRIERFGADGASLASWPLANTCQPSATDLAVQPDGGILVVGGGTAAACLTRYTPAGTLDTTFGSAGIVDWRPYVSGSSNASDILLAQNGKAMLTVTDTASVNAFIRFGPDGQPDAAFGVPNGTAVAATNARTVAPACGGKFVSPLWGQDSLYTYVGLTRYNSNGSLDLTTSGTPDGIVSTFISWVDTAEGVLVRDDGVAIVQATGRSGTVGATITYLVAYRQRDCQQPADSSLSPVIEFYNPSLNHYFISGAAPDIEALDSGRLVGWRRTGYTFATPSAISNPVCRFYIPPAYGDSHFFSASGSECGDVQTRFPQFAFETPDAYRAEMPDVVNGVCSSATPVPIYRVWNAKAGTNHRYVTDKDVRDAMVAAGWVAEGYGTGAVAMCTRQQ